MIRKIKLLLIVILLILSCPIVRAQEKIDVDNKTFIYNNKTYNYNIDYSEEEIKITIDLDGCTYYRSYPNNGHGVTQASGTEGKCANYQIETANLFLDEIVKAEKVEEELKQRENNRQKAERRESSYGAGILIMILGIIGLISIISPQAMWYLQFGWRIKNAEPSDAALLINKVIGLIALVTAIVLAITIL